MCRLFTVYSSNKTMAWVVIPLCLLLISMGIRLPSLNKTHTPKPRPRAVMESSIKSAKHAAANDAAAKCVVAVEFVNNVPPVETPVSHRSRFVTGPCQYSSIAPTQSDARGPPLHAS